MMIFSVTKHLPPQETEVGSRLL